MALRKPCSFQLDYFLSCELFTIALNKIQAYIDVTGVNEKLNLEWFSSDQTFEGNLKMRKIRLTAIFFTLIVLAASVSLAHTGMWDEG